jgi:hypothetical protein
MKSEFLLQIGYSNLYRVDGAVIFESGMQIDADGAPHAYHPSSGHGLDHLSNAGRPGNWWGIETNTLRKTGKPVVQDDEDPAPGFYISTTALEISKVRAGHTQRRYIDSENVPFIVLPRGIGLGCSLGDLCLCFNTKTGDNDYGIYADIGPANHIGEASIAMADSLSIPNNPRTGGTGHGIYYCIFPGSGKKEQSKDEWFPKANTKFRTWGGLDKLREFIGGRKRSE